MSTRVRDRSLPDAKVDPTISVDRAADILGVDRAVAYAEVRRGNLPHIRLGRRIVVPTALFLTKYGLTPAA